MNYIVLKEKMIFKIMSLNAKTYFDLFLSFFIFYIFRI